jgi:hypothetical protein
MDPGAAQREAGFHRFLAGFMAWDLPIVKRFDGSEGPLYLQTLFPLFFVEQKVGWTTIPGAIPTHFRIREVHRRALEFLMGFDTHALELRRQDLEQRIAEAREEWAKTAEALVATATASGLKVQNLPKVPTALESDVRATSLQALEGGEWVDLERELEVLAQTLNRLEHEQIPKVESIAGSATAEAEALNAEVLDLNAERAMIFRDRQAEIIQHAATLRRIEQLEEDLQKNRDALKLQKFGSTVSRDLDPNHCPTCEQPLDDALLPQGTLEAVMSIEDNIEFLAAQRVTFKRLLVRSAAVIRELDLELASSGEILREKSARLRTVKSDLIAPSHAASASFIEERLRIEQKARQLLEAKARFEEHLGRLIEQSERWAGLQTERMALPEERLSANDFEKLRALEASIRAQLALYGFKTFAPDALSVSPDTYRPEKEGFEIGFELSASDSIRLKWAYQLGLLEVSRHVDTNHPGLVVFDEPRQQEASEVSVANLLAEAARIAGTGAQIVIATSEQLATVRTFLTALPNNLIVFEGPMIHRVEA